MPLPLEYQKLLGVAKSNRKSNKAFFEKLKKKRPRDLDAITNEFHDNAFKKIDCLLCANCCTSTGPLLKNRDIHVLADNFKMRPSVFADTYLKIDEDNDYVFKSLPCPFLG